MQRLLAILAGLTTQVRPYHEWCACEEKEDEEGGVKEVCISHAKHTHDRVLATSLWETRKAVRLH